MQQLQQLREAWTVQLWRSSRVRGCVNTDIVRSLPACWLGEVTLSWWLKPPMTAPFSPLPPIPLLPPPTLISLHPPPSFLLVTLSRRRRQWLPNIPLGVCKKRMRRRGDRNEEKWKKEIKQGSGMASMTSERHFATLECTPRCLWNKANNYNSDFKYKYIKTTNFASG